MIHGYRLWTIQEQLQAHTADLIALSNWQRAGRKHAPKPQPIERPWLKAKSKALGKDPIPVADFNAWWDSFEPASA